MGDPFDAAALRVTTMRRVERGYSRLGFGKPPRPLAAGVRDSGGCEVLGGDEVGEGDEVHGMIPFENRVIRGVDPGDGFGIIKILFGA